MRRVGILLLTLAALAASGAAITLATSGRATAPITREEAMSFARAVNLRASDLPGTIPTLRQPGSPPSTAHIPCYATTRHAVANEANILFERQRQEFVPVASAVVVMPSEAVAQALMAALTSRHGRGCLARRLGETVVVEGKGAKTKRRITSSTVRATFTPISKIVGPESVALHVLAKLPPLLADQRTRLEHILHKRLPMPKATFSHRSLAIFRIGPAEIALTWEGRNSALPTSTEDYLLALLHTRAEEHKL